MWSAARGSPKRSASRTAIEFEANTVAFETEEAGNRPTGRFVVVAGDDAEALVDALASVLGEDGATVERDGDEVVVRRSTFDPEAARALGVPEGPAFGRLSAGQAVELDCETVEPEAVHATRTERYRIRPERD